MPCWRQLSSFEQHQQIARLYFSEMGAHELNIGSSSDMRQTIRTHFLERLSEVFRAAIQKGQSRFDAEDAYALAYALQNLTNAFVVLALKDPDRRPYKRTIWPVLNAIFDGLLTKETGQASTATGASSRLERA